jgi:branched-chain amino acid transport system ATP-binding protein
LDEPAAGMNPTESAALREMLRGLAAEGIAILLIEHDVRLVMGVCERVAVLNFGRKIAEGTPAQIQGDPEVRDAYLGVTDDA